MSHHDSSLLSTFNVFLKMRRSLLVKCYILTKFYSLVIWFGLGLALSIMFHSEACDSSTHTHTHTRKPQTNNPDKYECKNPQQNISKLNSTKHLKDCLLWPSGIYFWDARMVQHMQINQCETSYQQNKGRKPCDHFNWCWKRIQSSNLSVRQQMNR